MDLYSSIFRCLCIVEAQVNSYMTNTVIITGASQGIGKATALLFARHNYNVVLAARQLDRLEAIATEIREMGQQAIAISTDVKDATQVNNMMQKAIAHFGQVDVLINNAGIFCLGSVENFSLEDWHQIIDTNLWGYIHTIHAILPHFLQRGAGTIVNVSSIGGLEPIPYHVPYTASKYAITGLTKSLHAELSPKNIHVSGIYPSFISTQLMERAIFRGKDEEMAQARTELVGKAIQMPVLEKPEDVAKAIWSAVKEKRSDVVVGSANFWKAAYQLTPSLIQSLVRRVFGMEERK
ncbi:SDR family oxidoreductase [Nostoc sp. PCC 7120 = FACHB-418]|uniref:Oxidoreductase n=3 Tax=Nostocales TaxID=1161 RepID=A0A1Z4KI09_ANAVA|nr:SDR family oxidoreductase [Anabaena cylindrica FACHB-318]MBD2262348.1 SDR family oxidoreductase [Anabaena sp. FACHB-709]MBD2276040.1 SDR family oxidoreductase [Nostoc sp. PCC 7120 = FACHB-418]MBD2281791.1 SDR family oxidoreductase [Anabaena cylindrica FACHB-170]MBD2347497.1 SDR family oxidoreductase [Trichormus variabilis FACHB-171]BAY68587.1 oxidoreductase [Trichormus variabilis NIES-23]HBW30196.1 SDR family NAD(P)-dependent oxidoreductase [Nostoc sp. UBA8866]